MNNTTTIVTCYYQVPSKHSHSIYDKWIKNMLNHITANIVIFTSENLVTYLKDCAMNRNNVFIIKKNFEEIEMNVKYKDIWEKQYEIDPQKKNRTKECYIIWNSKMNFVKEAIQLNIFNNEKFIWTDIGSMRDLKLIPLIKNYPINSKISDNKLDITIINNFTNNSQKYFQDECHLSGAIYGANKDIFLKIIELYYKYFEEYLANGLFIGCDQQILSTIYTQHPDLVNLINGINPYTDKWFFLWLYYSIN